MAREPSWSINYRGLAAVFPRDTKASLPRERRLLAERKEETRRKGGKDAATDKSRHATQKQSAMVLARVCRVMHWYRQVIYAYGACRSIRTSRAHACARDRVRDTRVPGHGVFIMHSGKS